MSVRPYVRPSVYVRPQWNTMQPQTKQWYLLGSMRHSQTYDFQGHPRSGSRWGDDLSPLSGLFFYLFIHSFGGFSCLMAQTTRTRARMCLTKWVKFSQTPNFPGANRRFQAKCAKNSNFHIFEATAWIETKFSTMIKTTKYPSWMVQIQCMPETNPRWQSAQGRELRTRGVWGPKWQIQPPPKHHRLSPAKFLWYKH